MSGLRGVLRAGFFVLAVVVAGSVAGAKSCADLSNDLKSMQQAQASLLDSMVRKNDMVADTFENYRHSFSIKKKLAGSDLAGLKKSATAFRSHGSREEKLVARFKHKTDEIIRLVEACLIAGASPSSSQASKD